MKNIRKIAYIVLIAIIAIFTFIIYATASKSNNQDEKEKTFTEVEFLELRLMSLLNTMNNIQANNYRISYGEISKESSEENQDSSSQSDSKNGTKDTNQTSGSESEQGNGANQDVKSDSFELEKRGVLTNSEDINWDEVKNEIENLYGSMPNITLDLYRTDINQDDILNFNKELDNLTVAAKDENKEKTLEELSKLYDYMPLFFQNITDDELYQKTVETKSYIFKAYSKLDSKKWNEISKDTTNAINTFSQLLTNTQIDTKKQYSINRIYVMINELQNAASLQSEEIFLVKYKNIVEEITNL